MNAFQNFLQSPIFHASVFKIGLVLSLVVLFTEHDITASMLSAQVKDETQQEPGAQSESKPKLESKVESKVEAAATEKTSSLISADQLKALLASKPGNIKLLEPGSDQATFAICHLPSAQFVHWVNDMTDPKHVKLYNSVDRKQFEDLMVQLGIKNDDHVIIYDRLNSRLSTRLFWTFKLYGHSQVQILDGGFNVWISKQHPITKDVVKTTASKYKVVNTEDKIMAKLELVKAQLEKPEVRLIDGRPPKQYSGEEPGKVFHTNEAHPRKGHIPGAINVFWKDNFNDDGTFKSPEQLRELYRSAGVEQDNEVITYCNEGLHAAPPWFVLHELLGFESVRLYDSSMAEWANAEVPMKKTK